jgi:hypothetical protein
MSEWKTLSETSLEITKGKEVLNKTHVEVHWLSALVLRQRCRELQSILQAMHELRFSDRRLFTMTQNTKGLFSFVQLWTCPEFGI